MECGKYSLGTVLNMKCSASIVVKNKSGRWVIGDDSGYLHMGSATAVNILGWVEGTFEATSVASEGGSSWPIETAFLNKLWVMPACYATATAATEAQLQAGVGETIDITMESTYYQYADFSLSAIDILLVYGYIYEGSAYGQQYAIVKINPVKLAYTTH